MEPSCALVIGVEEYWRDDACLVGPARDAMNMAAWLMKHGGVERENLRVLVSPLDRNDVDPNLWDGPATQDAIVSAVRKLPDLAQECGLERVYFYYSGHGLQDVSHPTEPIILPADFSEELRHKSILLAAVTTFLQMTGIPEQFVIADACRDFPLAGERLLGASRQLFGVDVDRLPNGQDNPFQAQLLAATPGGTARIVSGVTGRESAFTSEMLAALTAPGPAMRWDLLEGRYVVRSDQLFRHLGKAINERAAADPLGDPDRPPCRPVIQILGPPRKGAPVLASFAPGEVPDVPLSVVLDPDGVRNAEPEVTLSLDGVSDAMNERPREDLVARFSVRPSIYVARAAALRYRQEQPRYAWEVYEAMERTIRLVPDDGGDSDGPRRATDIEPHDEPGSGGLTVESSDGLSVVELRTESGRPVAVGYGRVDLESAAAGIYLARELSPTATTGWTESPIAVRPGERQRIRLDRVDGTNIERTAWHVTRLAALTRLGRYGRPLRDNSSPTRFPDGDRLGTPQPDLTSRLRIGCFIPDIRYAPVGVTISSGGAATRSPDPLLSGRDVMVFEDVVASGRCRFRVTFADGRDIDVAIPVVAGSTTNAAVTFTGFGSYAVTLHIDDGRPYRSLAPLASAQFHLAAGDRRAAAAAADKLPGLLAALVRTAAGQTHDADLRLLNESPGLRSDALVYQAIAAEPRNPDRAQEALLDACRAGLPVTATAIRLLHDRSRRWGIRHERVDQAAQLILGQLPGTMWSTVWTEREGPEPRAAHRTPTSPPSGPLRADPAVREAGSSDSPDRAAQRGHP